MRVSLNKNALKQQRDQLAMFRRFLPSLELKKQQLLVAWKQSRIASAGKGRRNREIPAIAWIDCCRSSAVPRWAIVTCPG